MTGSTSWESAKVKVRRTVLAAALRRTPAVERLALARAELPSDTDPAARRDLIDRFNRLYYDEGRAGGTWHRTEFLGVTTWKCPLDLWLYQEMIHRLRPALIIETGTAFGGSALYLGTLCDAVGGGEVVSVDIAPQANLPTHPKVRYITASSTDPAVVAELTALAAARAEQGPTVVILDSDHSEAHVGAELEAYAPLVPVGSYLVVEDTNVNGHPSYPEHGPGPHEAVEAFLARRLDFERDPEADKFHLTFNPGGWLRRVR